MLNERDGGIGGVPVRVVECETGYNTEKGVECYESTKGEGALVYQPLSTGITYQLIPKASADEIPVFRRKRFENRITWRDSEGNPNSCRRIARWATRVHGAPSTMT